MQKKIRVLFLQSQARTWSWSIANVHRILLEHFDQERIESYVACALGPGGAKTPASSMFEAIPNLHLRPTNFGPAIFEGSRFSRVKNLLVTGLATPGSLIGLINYVKQNHIEVIHSAEIPRDALCNVFLGRITGARSVIHLHSKCGSWMRPAVFRAMRQADAIIGVSAFVAQSAIEIGGCQPKRVHYALNSLDVSQWNNQLDGDTIRQERQIPSQALVFSIVGRVGPWKGHDLLLKALARIKNDLPDFRLLVVGCDAPAQDGSSYTAYIQKQVHTLGLSQQVIFMGQRSDIPAILAASDLYTMPALEEGFCLAILEAMAMQKPVVALASGGPREIVEQGRSGLLSPPDDVEQLAENILTLANNAALRREMGLYGRQRVETYFNSQRQANDVEQIYRLVLGHGKAPDEVSRKARPVTI